MAATTANVSSRARQAEISLVTSAVLKSSPAASRKVYGSMQPVATQGGGGAIFGRGRGSGIGLATALAPVLAVAFGAGWAKG
jgi:hypothetical protein